MIHTHIHEPLALSPMREAIGCLEGERDYASFQAVGCDALHAVRRVYRNALEQDGDLILYSIEATAFVRHMVRNIVGTLVEVGRRQRAPESLVELLEARDRTKAGRTAPAHGLFLMEVKY